MKPSRISIAMLVMLLPLVAAFAQSSDSSNQNTASSAAAASSTEVPRLIKFSGTLLDERGHAMPGPVGVTFALYAQQAGGAALWLETQNVKPDANGDYIVLLGANSAKGVPMELFASAEARWLGVQPEGQVEQPRVLLVSVPYALKAGDAETLGGKPASAFALSGSLAGSAGNPSVSQTIVAPVVAATASGPGPSADSASAASGSITAATACTTITADGTALANQVAKFSGPCQIHQSLISDSGTAVSVAGAFNHPAVAAATSTLGQNSFSANFTASSFSSSTHLPVNQNFRWQAEPVGNNTSSPSGKLNLLFASGTGTPAETGLSVSNKGVFTFAPGQAFSGNGGGLTNVNAAQLGGVAATGYAKLAAANTFTQPQSIKGGASGNLLSVQGTGTGTGSFTVDASGSITNSGLIVSGNDINTSGFLFSNGLGVTGSANFSGATTFSGATSFSGLVGINTSPTTSRLSVNAGAGTGLDGVTGTGADGSSAIGTGNGVVGSGGNSSLPGAQGGVGVRAFGGTASGGAAALGGIAVEALGGSSAGQGGAGVVAEGAAGGGIQNGGIGVGATGGGAQFGTTGLGGSGIDAVGGTNGDGTQALAGNFRGNIAVNCVITPSGNFGSGCPSDVRFKKDIQAFPAVLDKLVQLQPVTYNWRTEEFPQRRFPSDRAIGLIAQEVEKVFPEMVSNDAAGYKGVNYGELPYLMLQAIRELKAENDNLRERIQRLEIAASKP